ncbi:helix-turn-helix domain-containing protein [Dehalococcoidia bacterium]|nr:helix-turn-helix domain-containing protein [Dehalococcoidia bacterium]MCL0074504.1 helix-turn-helix domain-containing protein [Dehalococcoidia bacterium]
MTTEKRRKKKLTTDAVEILYRRIIGENADMKALLAEAESEMDIAEQIYNLRTEAGLSQQELADKIGTSASVICRLEDADYEGHSLSMLRRIAAALDRRVKVSFLPLDEAVSAR